MKTNNFSIEEIIGHESRNFEEAYRIIQERIPFGERSDVLDFITTLNQARDGKIKPDNYHMLIAVNDSIVIGTITGYYIFEINMGFVNTLGVNPNYEGAGIGSALRQELVKKFRQDARKNRKKLSGILGEVEEINPWLRKLISNPKIFPFDIRYLQPPLREGQDARELVLYLQTNKSKTKILCRRVIKIIEAIYRNIYDIESPNKNIYFNRTLENIGNRRYISKKTLNNV